MLGEADYSEFSIRKLAQRANVSRATLYNLYGSRDKLAVAAVQNSLREIADLVAAHNPEPGIDTLLTSSRIAAEQTLAYPHYWRVMARVLLNAEPEDDIVEALYGPQRLTSADQIEIARQAGQLRSDLDTVLFAQHLNAQAWGVTLSWFMGRFSDEQLVRERMRATISALMSVATGPVRKDLKAKLLCL